MNQLIQQKIIGTRTIMLCHDLTNFTKWNVQIYSIDKFICYEPLPFIKAKELFNKFCQENIPFNRQHPLPSKL
jgi:hypothetical protein